MSRSKSFDVVVIGSGPGGQKAAEEAARQQQSVLLIEKKQKLGGACVEHGTIPSKTLRATALALRNFQRHTDHVTLDIPETLQVRSLMSQLKRVVTAHQCLIEQQMMEAGIQRWHGLARFRSANEIKVEAIDGTHRVATGKTIVIATGSRPRDPEDILVDHETILDSDSILSLAYLPRTLTVLGGGVIASEYASIFASLGVQVVMIDRHETPLGFVDPEMVERFLQEFERAGGRFLGGVEISSVEWDGVTQVVTALSNGAKIVAEKALFTLGRVANTDRLNLSAAGIELTERGMIPVNESGQTVVPHIYAVGDVIGPPALAATAMSQGRCASRHALGRDHTEFPELVPMGIYSIPELSCVGIHEQQAIERYGSAVVGVANFSDIARCHIAASPEGYLKLVADPDGNRLLGVQIVGNGASELIHLGQMALQHRLTIDAFVDSIFNFPTMAEAYRIAALQILRQRREALVLH